MKQKPKQGVDLHKFIASGGLPKDYISSKGINSSTVPGLKDKKKNK